MTRYRDSRVAIFSSFLLFLLPIDTLFSPTFFTANTRAATPSSTLDLDSYQGFGTTTRGAQSSPLGWNTVTVTSLADNGPGSLRDAISRRLCGSDQHDCNTRDTDPANQVWGRKIIFAPGVAGDLLLHTDIAIQRPYLTIDGSTADAPGITIGKINPTDGEVKIVTGRQPWQLAHHIIINNLRFSASWDQAQLGGRNNRATLILDGTAADPGVQHIIIDHCTFRDATDSSPDLYGHIENVTLSWNLIYNALHPMTISSDNPSDLRKNLSLHHNVFAYTHERNPQLRGNVEDIDYINNIVYNWTLSNLPGYIGFVDGGYGVSLQCHQGTEPNGVNVINNHFLSDKNPQSALVCVKGHGNNIYLHGNRLPPENVHGCRRENLRTSSWSTPSLAQVTIHPLSELPAALLADVGVRYADVQEQSLIEKIILDIATHTAIDSAAAELLHIGNFER